MWSNLRRCHESLLESVGGYDFFLIIFLVLQAHTNEYTAQISQKCTNEVAQSKKSVVIPNNRDWIKPRVTLRYFYI